MTKTERTNKLEAMGDRKNGKNGKDYDDRWPMAQISKSVLQRTNQDLEGLFVDPKSLEQVLKSSHFVII